MVKAELSRLRALDGLKWTKYGADVLPAFVADMDFEPASAIKAAMVDVIQRGDLGYHFVGRDALIGAWADWQEQQHGWRPPEEHCYIFTGTLHGLETVMLMNSEPGDGVVIFSPIYEPFRVAVEDSGRRVIDVPLTGPDWRFDPEQFEAALDDTTKIVLFCQPHNPLGRVFDAHELAAFGEIAERHDLLVISDEIWADLVLDGATHLPLANIEALRDRLMVLGSASKTFSLAGLRCAVTYVSPAHIRTKLDGLPVHALGAPSSLSTVATVVAWTQCQPWLDAVVHQINQNRELLLERVAHDLPGVTMHEPQATYLAWLDFAATPLANNPFEAVLNSGVALDPGPKFGTQCTANARLNYATSPELLNQIIDRIATCLQEAT